MAPVATEWRRDSWAAIGGKRRTARSSGSSAGSIRSRGCWTSILSGAAALRDAGMEVIYTGLHQTPEMIASAAVQEDVDVVGLSILSGAHMTLFPRVRDLLRDAARDDILITGGGIIPREDMDELQR